MLRRALRLAVLAILLIAAVLTPLQSGRATGVPAPSNAANPPDPATAQAPAARFETGAIAPRAAGQAQARPRTAQVAGAESAKLDTRGAVARRGAVAAGRARVAADYGDLPLAFERNEGQTDASVSYLARGQGYTAFLTQAGITLALAPITGTAALPAKAGLFTPHPALAAASVPGPVVSAQLEGASAQAQAQAADPLPGVVNYFVGNDATKWHTGIPTFGQVSYPDVYPGIDLVYHGQGRDVAFDFTVRPGAQVDAIRLHLAGVSGAAPDPAGDLEIAVGGATLTAKLPEAYQDIAGAHRPVGVHYRLLGGGDVGFSLESYDATQPVTIDPVLVYSSYLGGSYADTVYGVAVSSAGNMYLTGFTDSPNFPTANPLQHYNSDVYDAFVSEIAADGRSLVYSTYLSGTYGTGSADTEGGGIAVDSAGNAYVTGGTSSSSFPLVNALQPYLDGSYDAFVSEIAAGGGSLVYSTYLGGSGIDTGSGVAVDGAGNTYVAGGASANFPTINAFQMSYPGNGGSAGFVSKISASSRRLVYSTYLGGSAGDRVTSIAVDAAGSAYVTGNTQSANFPTTTNYSGVGELDHGKGGVG